MTSSKKPKKSKGNISLKRKKSTFLRILMRAFFISIVWAICLMVLVVLWFSYDLPKLEQLQQSARKPSVTIQTQNGQVIGTYGDLFEDMVRVEDLPPYVPQAMLAVEDRRFYHHFGIDIIGLIRAAYINYKADRVVQGGSTISQQLAKNFLQNQGLYDVNDRSLRRKIQEAIMSVWLEWTFSKDQILSMYLNRMYLGAGTYGIDAAARKYFGKSSRNLTVFEAAVIAGLLKAPSKYSPAQNIKKSKERAKVVLDLMADAGYIRNADAYMADADRVSYASPEHYANIRYFTDWIYKLIPNYIGQITQDIVVVVTLDIDLQKKAEEACLKKFEEFTKKLKTTELALVSMMPDGAVKVLVGGMNYQKNQFNHVTDALRQPGSAFKIFIYLAAIEAGLTPETLMDDSPYHSEKWNPGNFKWVSQGEIPLRMAFANSVNSISIRLTEKVGPQKVAKAAEKLGVSSMRNAKGYHLSLSLGTVEVTLLELTSAFATFSNHGKSVWPYGVLEIRDKKGNILYQRQEPDSEKIVELDVVNSMRELFKANVLEGTGRAANIGIPLGGKTGSNGDLDAWFVGYGYVESMNEELVTGIWTGNDNNKPMAKNSTGGVLPARVWAEYMLSVIERNAPANANSKAQNGKLPAGNIPSAKAAKNLQHPSTPAATVNTPPTASAQAPAAEAHSLNSLIEQVTN